MVLRIPDSKSQTSRLSQSKPQISRFAYGERASLWNTKGLIFACSQFDRVDQLPIPNPNSEYRFEAAVIYIESVKMFSRIFGKPKEETNALTSIEKLNETLEMLEKKEKVLQKKASAEVEKAKEFTRAKNKRAAIQCLKRKRLYEQQIEQLGNFQLRIHDQMIMLEGAKATTETVDALRTGAAAMKSMQKATNIDDVDKTMDEINEQTENMKQIQEALATPIGAAADFDEDELEAELEELEEAELEEQLLQPATSAPAAPVRVPTGKQPARPAPKQQTEEEGELAALRAEMALS
nr:vacuolar protein sorting-associated protein 32 homolog 2 [Ipomoea batatas]